METGYDGRQVVSMDLYRRRSVLVRMTENGRRPGTVRITNSPAELRAQIARAASRRGWSWKRRSGGTGRPTPWAPPGPRHLAQLLGVKAFSYRRVKDDERDAADLAICCGWAGWRRRGSPRHRWGSRRS
jgi:hypothetical protein